MVEESSMLENDINVRSVLETPPYIIVSPMREDPECFVTGLQRTRDSRNPFHEINVPERGDMYF